MSQILLREQVRNDLYVIVDYMAEQNPDLPQRFIDELQPIYDVLHDHPELSLSLLGCCMESETWKACLVNRASY